VTAGRVDARAVQTAVWIATLVDVATVSPGRVHLEPGVAVAPEQADQVLAASVDAQVAKRPTLVDVLQHIR